MANKLDDSVNYHPPYFRDKQLRKMSRGSLNDNDRFFENIQSVSNPL